MNTTAKRIVADVRKAGYEIVTLEQLRPNRWLLIIRDDQGVSRMLLAQQRSLVSSADVQDLAEMLQLRNIKEGLLLAVDGTFSPVAHRTVLELRDRRILLCTSLPSAPTPPNPVPVLSSL